MEKYTSFDDIPQLTEIPTYSVTLGWGSIERQLQEWEDYPNGFDLCPDFQRGHVWTEEQQIRFVEFALRGGLQHSGSAILFNSVNWNNMQSAGAGEIQCVDGLQRMTAARLFMANKIPAFGSYYKEYDQPLRLNAPRFQFFVNDLPTREGVLKWYLDLNSGGTVHSPSEIARVQEMLNNEREKSSAPGKMTP